MGNKSSKAEIDNQKHGGKNKKKGKKLERAFSDSDIPSMRQKNPNKTNNVRPVSNNIDLILFSNIYRSTCGPIWLCL